LAPERKLWKKGYKAVVGLDEAGRGPLAGPVTAAAVTIRPAKLKVKSAKLKVLLKEIKDSKKLSQKKREKLCKLLIKNPAIGWGIGRVSEKVIDKINILEATKLAMKRAVRSLEKKLKKKRKKSPPIDFLLIDGNFKIGSKIPQKAIVKADEKIFSCAAASIIAKVHRDAVMKRYHKKYPKYNFAQHKGYPTKEHIKALGKYGCCKIHRKSFGPIRRLELKAQSSKRKAAAKS